MIKEPQHAYYVQLKVSIGKSELMLLIFLRRTVAMSAKKSFGLWSAISISIGAMVAGFFPTLGLGGQIAGNALYISFLIAGLVALLSTYSYAKMGARYPSAGGPVGFYLEGFGDSILSGALGIFLWITWIIALALYSKGFGEYAAALLPANAPGIWANIFATAVILIFTAINFRGARAVGRSETLIVVIMIGILATFVVVGFFLIKPELLSLSKWPNRSDILVGAASVFVVYSGFGLITTSAEDMETPQKILPTALYLSVIIVTVMYVLICFAIAGTLSVPEIISARDYALAQAAQPVLGSVGPLAIVFAVLLATSSGVNGTLYGGAHVTYTLVKNGALPTKLESLAPGPSKRRDVEGLFITAGLTIFFVNSFDLRGIAALGSASFLILYAAVSVAHLRRYRDTKAKPYIIWSSIIACLALLGLLVLFEIMINLMTFLALVIILGFSFIGEWSYRKYSGRAMRTRT
jgi:amino acid transporter